MARLFISYRRSDTGGYADRLAARLAAFQFDAVFQDRENIDLSTNYADEIRSALSQCDAVLVLIGGGWTHAQDPLGRRRLDDPADWVRREVSLAIKLRVPIIPVLFDGARLPSASEIPADLTPLTTAQGYDINGNYFDRDADDLSRRLEEELVARHRPTRDRQETSRDSFLNQLLGISVALFFMTFTSSIVPSFAPALPQTFWICPGSLTFATFAWWIYYRGEALRLRPRLA